MNNLHQNHAKAEVASRPPTSTQVPTVPSTQSEWDQEWEYKQELRGVIEKEHPEFLRNGFSVSNPLGDLVESLRAMYRDAVLLAVVTDLKRSPSLVVEGEFTTREGHPHRKDRVTHKGLSVTTPGEGSGDPCVTWLVELEEVTGATTAREGLSLNWRITFVDPASKVEVWKEGAPLGRGERLWDETASPLQIAKDIRTFAETMLMDERREDLEGRDGDGGYS